MKKAALITGAGSGIGRATALEFSRQGYFVYLMGRNKERLEEVALQCRNGSSLLSADINIPAQVEKRLPEIFDNPLYQLQVLVNNAGIYAAHGFEEGTDELWHQQFETNLFAPVRLTRLLWPYFKKQKGGSVLNVSSTLGVRPNGNTGAYSASKAALQSFTQSLAQEGGPFGIRVNCICPGIVDTPIHPFHTNPDKSKIMEQMGPLQPLGRIGTAEELARSIYFLASPESSWTTGAILCVDGGIQLQ